jgi:excisionase family DNA binding protein
VNDAALPSVPTRLGASLVTADDVAEYLQIDRASVYRLAGREIPCVEIGRTKRFRVADVLAYVEHRTRCPMQTLSQVERLLGRRSR